MRAERFDLHEIVIRIMNHIIAFVSAGENLIFLLTIRSTYTL